MEQKTSEYMLPFLLNFSIAFPLAQVNSASPPVEFVRPQEVRPLSGNLDDIPVFNSNSPELVLKEGILLSTFPQKDKRVPEAHLNFPFRGRFDVFAHHVAKAATPEDLRTLYIGVILHNPGKEAVKVDVLHAASYLSQPDAPFVDLPAQENNLFGKVHAGPGSRTTHDVLRSKRQSILPPQIEIPAGESKMLFNSPIPVKEFEPPLNGRSTLMRLRSSGTVYAASLAMFAPNDINGQERPPTLAEWEKLLKNGGLAGPRDKKPTPPNETNKSIIYGRVAGVAKGSSWRTLLRDSPKVSYLTIPARDRAISYGISTLDRGTLGSGQIQSAPMLVRYPDTAYRAHGNYGVQYSLSLPLYNNTNSQKTVSVSLQTPIKEDKLSKKGLRFLTEPAKRVFFRGTVLVRYSDDKEIPQTRYVHLVQNRGEQGKPLATLNIKPNDTRLVQLDFLYPPDATPPQVLTVRTF